MEARLTKTYELHRDNTKFTLTESFVKVMIEAILFEEKWAKKAGLRNAMRIHSSGEFYNDKYIKSWVAIAKNTPSTIYYGYTKNLKAFEKLNKLSNVHITFSIGGTDDKTFFKNVKRGKYGKDVSYCIIVTDESQALKLNVPIICESVMDDMEYIINKKPFALKIHGTQKKGFKGNVKKINDFINSLYQMIVG
jgi:hypothetical protein